VIAGLGGLKCVNILDGIRVRKKVLILDVALAICCIVVATCCIEVGMNMFASGDYCFELKI